MQRLQEKQQHLPEDENAICRQMLSCVCKASARIQPNSCGARRFGPVDIRRVQQFPPQVVPVEKEQRFRIVLTEFFEDPSLPPFGEVGLWVHVLSEKPTLVRNADEIEYGRNHVEMGNQDRLGQVLSEILVGLDPFPE